MGLISTYNKDRGTAVGRYSNLCLASREKAGWQILAAFAKHLEPTNSVQALSAAIYTTVLQTQAVAEQEEPALLGCSLRCLFLPATGPWHCLGDRNR